MKDSEQILTPTETANFLDACTDSVRTWADSGKLRVIRTRTGRRLFRLTDVEAFKQKREERQQGTR